jgi:heterotetrameric sarcosine oxidase gamma subunit
MWTLRECGCVDDRPIARSPITPAPPIAVVDGWEVSRRQATAALTLSDRTPLAKVLVHAEPAGPYAATAVNFGRAVRRDGDVLDVGSGVGEWLLLGPVGSASALEDHARSRSGGEPVSIVDLTHGRALARLTGQPAAAVLSKVCGVDFRDEVTPDLSAFRSIVAKVVTDVVRDDLDQVPSYLLHCERASGQYLFDVLVDAGAEHGLEVSGFSDGRSS